MKLPVIARHCPNSRRLLGDRVSIASLSVIRGRAAASSPSAPPIAGWHAGASDALRGCANRVLGAHTIPASRPADGCRRSQSAKAPAQQAAEIAGWLSMALSRSLSAVLKLIGLGKRSGPHHPATQPMSESAP